MKDDDLQQLDLTPYKRFGLTILQWSLFFGVLSLSAVAIYEFVK